MANGLAIGPGDSVWVYDPANARIQVFDTGGTLRSSHALDIHSYGYVWDGVVDDQGRLLQQVLGRVADSMGSVLERVDIAARRVDTFPLPACAAPAPAGYRFPHGMMGVPYSGGPYGRLDRHGYYWCADTRRLQVGQYALGDTAPIRVFGAVVVPAVVTAAEREAGIAEVRKFMQTAGQGTPDFSLIPDAKPVLRRVDLDDQGRVWVQAQDSAGFEAFVFDSSGRLEVRAALPFAPSAWRPTVVRGGHLWAVTEDSLGLPGVTRYRLE